jgi:hypothetical protein
MATAILFGAAAGLGLYDWLSSKGQTLTITDNVLTDMSISSNYSSTTSCTSSVSGTQNITLEQGGAYPPTAHGQLTNATSSCVACQNALSSIQDMRNDLEAAAVVQSNGLYQTQTASPAALEAMGGGIGQDNAAQGIGACTLMCTDTVALNIQQSQTFKSKTNCNVTTDVSNEIGQSINGKITANLKNQEGIIGQLEDAFTSNTESIVNNLSSQMSQTLTTSVRQILANNAKSVQNFNDGLGALNSDGQGSHSVYINTVSQAFTSNSVATMSANNQLINSLKQSADYSISSQLLNKNDTLGDISSDFLKIIDSMGQFLNVITGDVLIIIGSLLAIFVLLVSGFFLFNAKARQFMTNYVSIKANQVLNNARSSSNHYQTLNDTKSPFNAQNSYNLPPIQSTTSLEYANVSRSSDFLF